MKRCKYGKLKSPSKGRRCRKKPARGGKRRGRRASRKTSPVLIAALGGAVLLGGAAILGVLPQA